MVVWIGVDDTDSLDGMCTTYLATELVRDLTKDHDLIGYPRLVRLNPNIPWKTRGNGAVCIRIGTGRGRPRVVGQVDGRAVLTYPRSGSECGVIEAAQTVAHLVERWAEFDETTTNPGFVVLKKPPSPALYWKAVRGVVEKAEALAAVRGLGIVREYKNGRGVIGASAAAAWRPRDRTYEILAYRDASRWGSPRYLDPASVIEMDRTYPSTFNNYDHENARIVIAPHSPCPILFGVRGDRPEDLPKAMGMVQGELPGRWLLFETNQGTDDHVRTHGPVVPYSTVRYPGDVSARPRSLPGGHVVIRVGAHDVTAYEPSKQFRSVVRQLVPGDRVEVIGAVRRAPRTLNLEKLRIESLATVIRKVANPLCSACWKRAKSMGRDAGYRCAGCGRLFPRSAATWLQVPRSLVPGWYEPPVGSRRHLSKPLKRMVGTSTAARRGPSQPSGFRGRGSDTGVRPSQRPSRTAR